MWYKNTEGDTRQNQYQHMTGEYYGDICFFKHKNKPEVVIVILVGGSVIVPFISSYMSDSHDIVLLGLVHAS